MATATLSVVPGSVAPLGPIQTNDQRTQTFYGRLTVSGFSDTYPAGGMALDSVLLAALLPTSNSAPIRVLSGRYGPYIKHGATNANVPRGKEPTEITLEEAVALLAERVAKGGGKKPVKKAAAKKPAAEKKAEARSHSKIPASESQGSAKGKVMSIGEGGSSGYAREAKGRASLSRLSSKWVMRQHKVFQMLIQHMGVNLGGGDIGMAQQGLDHPQIGPACQ